MIRKQDYVQVLNKSVYSTDEFLKNLSNLTVQAVKGDEKGTICKL